MENLNCRDARFILIGRKDHLEKESELVKQIEQKYNALFIGIDKLTEGTACTVLFARKYINSDEPLLVANSDQIVDISVQEFVDDCLRRKIDGSILTFTDHELNPKWSFAKVDGNGYVIEVREKKPISDFATVGIYLFSKGNEFVNAAIDMIVNNDRVNNEFYTGPVYNYCISNGQSIGIYNMEFQQMHGIGIPEDLDKYLQAI
jgi:dTDP-glucose pyrophosphorylase